MAHGVARCPSDRQIRPHHSSDLGYGARDRRDIAGPADGGIHRQHEREPPQGADGLPATGDVRAGQIAAADDDRAWVRHCGRAPAVGPDLVRRRPDHRRSASWEPVQAAGAPPGARVLPGPGALRQAQRRRDRQRAVPLCAGRPATGDAAPKRRSPIHSAEETIAMTFLMRMISCARGWSVIMILCLCGISASAGAPAHAETFVPISGSGSTWSQNAIDQWRRNVGQFGIQVNYAGVGSSQGRQAFANRTVDFAVSEIPYGMTDTGTGVPDPPPSRAYAYMPIVAGGTSFMYNLKIGGKRVTNLRLSGDTITKIFTGVIKKWNDPAIAADNPALALPARDVRPVVRSDGSGTTAQFTLWMSKQFPSLWNAYCQRVGRAVPCGQTSNYPAAGFKALSGSLGVSQAVADRTGEGLITYVESSYALNLGFPVAKVLNTRGYYVEPTAPSVAVALLKARINQDTSSSAYLTQILDDVYRNPDPRAYPLSSYSYMILPTKLEAPINADKGRTLGRFSYYFLCEGQRQVSRLGYSPLPINLVKAGLTQVRRIPGVVPESVNIKQCNNPTFSPDGRNLLAATAPFPLACDKKGGPTQCTTGTGGARTPTQVSRGNGNTGSAGSGGAAGAGGSTAATGQSGGSASPGARPSAGTSIDPDTGLPVGTGPTVAGEQPGSTPVEVAGFDTGVRTALISIAILLLVGLVVGPPLVSRLSSRRRT